MPSLKMKLISFFGPLGGYNFCRALSRSTPRILMYHRFSEKPKPGFVDRKSFELHVEYLNNNFNVITMKELINIYKKKGSFPPNSVVVTVDDGYKDFYDIAFPVLKKYNLPATFFVTTRFVDGDFWLWPDTIRYILEQSSEIDLSSMPGDLEYSKTKIAPSDRQALWDMLVSYLLLISDDEKIQWINTFATIHDVKLPNRPVDEFSAVNWEQVQKLDANNIEIGAHTQKHPSLGRLEESQLLAEIGGAVDIIQNQIGHRPISFCFPNGQPSDYTIKVKQHVREAGCHSAVTAFYDEYLVEDLFEMRRFNVGADWSFFLRTVNGVDVFAARWLKTNNIMSMGK
jgi:peptidoglycan/xylan/chitin deacetylase (PgdA/CDA1 family)